MIKPDPSLEPNWDEDNINHIAEHGLRPEQVEEVYYGEGPFPTLALKAKQKGGRATEYRYRLWGTDASGMYIEAIIAPYPVRTLEVCNRISHVALNTENIFKENQKMSKLPKRIKLKLKKEAQPWDSFISKERPDEVSGLLEKAEPFIAHRPPRQPVSVRLDPFDLAMLKRIARNKGVPFIQLMSMWLHEKIDQEKARATF